MAIEKLKEKDFSTVLPKVKVNIAMCVAGAESKEDIAAVPSGLIFVEGFLKSYINPEFRASSHLASVLLKIRKIDNSIKSIMNVQFNENLKKAIKRLKVGKLNKETKECDIIIDEGGFGIEPCAYVLGKDAVDVVNKLLGIL